MLEDIRDSYPCPVEEAILTELVANSLDSHCSRIDILIEPKHRRLTFVDDGDFTGEGAIGFPDLAIIQENYGRSVWDLPTGGAGGALQPNPATGNSTGLTLPLKTAPDNPRDVPSGSTSCHGSPSTAPGRPQQRQSAQPTAATTSAALPARPTPADPTRPTQGLGLLEVPELAALPESLQLADPQPCTRATDRAE